MNVRNPAVLLALIDVLLFYVSQRARFIRLDAIAWTRFTVEAQAQLERDGALRQRRLGALGSVDSAGGVEVEEDEDAEEKPVKEKE